MFQKDVKSSSMHDKPLMKIAVFPALALSSIAVWFKFRHNTSTALIMTSPTEMISIVMSFLCMLMWLLVNCCDYRTHVKLTIKWFMCTTISFKFCHEMIHAAWTQLKLKQSSTCYNQRHNNKNPKNDSIHYSNSTITPLNKITRSNATMDLSLFSTHNGRMIL